MYLSFLLSSFADSITTWHKGDWFQLPSLLCKRGHVCETSFPDCRPETRKSKKTNQTPWIHSGISQSGKFIIWYKRSCCVVTYDSFFHCVLINLNYKSSGQIIDYFRARVLCSLGLTAMSIPNRLWLPPEAEVNT